MACEWCVQIIGAFFVGSRIIARFAYNDYCPLNVQPNALVQLVANVYYRYWDLGSIPRSPTLFNNFSCNMFLCSASSRDHHTTPSPSTPPAPEGQSNGHHQQSTIRTSQPFPTQSEKSTRPCISMGLTAANSPPNWADTPHV